MSNQLPTGLEAFFQMQWQDANGVLVPVKRPVAQVIGATLVDDPVGDAQTPGGRTVLTITGVPTSAQAGWHTALDLDLTAQGTHSLATDGTYTIGGMTFTKSNSNRDSVAMAVNSGAGLVVQPASNSYNNISAGEHRNFPALWLPFAQIPALAGVPIDYSTHFRLWAYVSADNCTTTGDQAVIQLDDNSAEGLSNFGLGFARGYPSSATAQLAAYEDVNNGSAFASTTNFTRDATTRVMMLEASPLMATHLRAAVGPYSAGWPSANGMTTWTQIIPLGNLNYFAVPVNAMNDVGITLGAVRATSATALSVTFARVRLDYHL